MEEGLLLEGPPFQHTSIIGLWYASGEAGEIAAPALGTIIHPHCKVTVRESLKLSSSQSQDSVGQRRIPIVDVCACLNWLGSLGIQQIQLSSHQTWPGRMEPI